MEENQDQIKFKISPKFNFFYEMGMPTGRKIRSSLIVGVIFIIATILLFSNKNSMEYGDTVLILNMTMFDTLKWIAIIAIAFSFIRAILCTVIQKLSYDHTTYTFYDKFMVYEDDFLNQHKKTIQYENVKEVEIRRTVWDRILGYGVIVMYTNAENKRKNGMVIYSIRNVKEIYEKIEKLVHDARNVATPKNVQISEPQVSQNDSTSDKVQEVEKAEKDFKDSLKNIN